ncbi:pre-mRNA-splicing factor CWC25-like protein [Gracilaria domingensis]|nr:pre-mRNA-splicing factor CWC25-like protein [Gracilaria domingensis]
MSALKFLSKKSWHTANIKNSEKVWLKEQEEAKEKSRIEELQKQIEEERKLKEAEELEVKAGRLDPEQLLKRRRINWMYEFGPSQSQGQEKQVNEKEQEDILTGKKEVTLQTLEEEKEKAEPSMIDIENKMREDPLLDIKRQRIQIAREQQLRQLYGGRESHSSERAEKLKRKQYRQAVREERRRRREARRPPRSEISTYAKSYMDSEDVSEFRRPEQTEPVRRHSTTFENEKSEYGLQLPEQGSGVVVNKRFIPRRRRFDQPPVQASGPTRTRRRFDQPPGFTCSSERATTEVGREDKATMLEQMRKDAEQIDFERKARTARYESDTRSGEIGSRKRKFSG